MQNTLVVVELNAGKNEKLRCGGKDEKGKRTKWNKYEVKRFKNASFGPACRNYVGWGNK